MPIVRITLSEQYELKVQDQISEAIHSALVECFRIPEDDYFQIFDVVKPTQLRFPRLYLGKVHTENIIFIQITAVGGRTAEQKKQVFATIAKNIKEKTEIDTQELIISLLENSKENWSFGDGEVPTFTHV